MKLKRLSLVEVEELSGNAIHRRLAKAINEVDSIRQDYMTVFKNDPDVIYLRQEIEMLRAKMGWVK